MTTTNEYVGLLRRHADRVDQLSTRIDRMADAGVLNPIRTRSVGIAKRDAATLAAEAAQLLDHIIATSGYRTNTWYSFNNDAGIAFGTNGDAGIAYAERTARGEGQFPIGDTPAGRNRIASAGLRVNAASLRVHAATARVVADLYDRLDRGEISRVS